MVVSKRKLGWSNEMVSTVCLGTMTMGVQVNEVVVVEIFALSKSTFFVTFLRRLSFCRMIPTQCLIILLNVEEI